MPETVSKRLYYLKRRLPELLDVENLIYRAEGLIRSRELTRVEIDQQQLPLYLLELGSEDPNAPALGLIGGIHGVERIGSQVILSFLHSLVERARWDSAVSELLQRFKLFVIPIANPGGMWLNTRANANGIDLMRNAPVEAEKGVPLFLGGQRISRYLPWYRGKSGAKMEPELRAISDYITQEILPRPFVMTLDCHSGFGLKDRLWFPYAGSFAPVSALGSLYRLNRLFRNSYPKHQFYIFEPQAHSYTTHGDIWDLLYDRGRELNRSGCFLPLTLEMGSWSWVKKNPRQLLRFSDLFHPMVPHRHSRILRRHFSLFEFLIAATRSHQNWQQRTEKQQRKDMQAAIKLWYEGKQG